MAKTTKTVEQSFEELDQIIAQMEDQTLPLETSFALYERGVKLLKSCQASIDKIEKKVLILQENGEFDEF